MRICEAIAGAVYIGYELKETQQNTSLMRVKKVVVKLMEKAAIRYLKMANHKENPMREIAIMQMIGNETPHVCGLLNAIEDDTRVYAVMNYLGTELLNFAGKLSEKMVQYCFRQIVEGVQAMQNLSLCHRDISLENVLVNGKGNCTIIDFGLAIIAPRMNSKLIASTLASSAKQLLRCRSDSGVTDEEDASSEESDFEMECDEGEGDAVSRPFDDNCRADVDDVTMPVLLAPQGTAGKENYIAPEILENNVPFDGLGVDNWSLAILLFILFTGRPPFMKATNRDKYFRSFQKLNLPELLMRWGIENTMSPLAAEFLDDMLRSTHPKDRYSCEDMLAHPWMTQHID